MCKNNSNNKLIEKLVQKLKEDDIKKVVAGAIIFFRDGILLLERNLKEFKGGLVELPSGNVEPNESIIEGLNREVKEETGLDILEIKRYIGSFDYQSSSGKKTRQFNFVVSVSSGDIQINPSEHSQFHIINPVSEKFQMLNISEKTRDIIQKSLSL